MIDPWTLQFPNEMVEIIGLSKNEIAFLKKKGCPFHGRKTCIAWVRDFLARQVGAPAQPPHAHHSRTDASIPHERAELSGSPAASLATR